MTLPARRAARKPAPPLELDFAAKAARIIKDYDDFLSSHLQPGEAEDPKAFALRHTSARAALGHLEHLMKVRQEQSAETPPEDGEDLLARARADLDRLAQEACETDAGCGTDDPIEGA